jgi:hypothetical protein
MQQLIAIDELRSSVENIHRAAETAATNRCSAVAERRKNLLGVAAANFDIGDYVLVAKREFHAGEKLTLRWRGPFRIVGTLSDHVYEVEDLSSGRVTSIHASRLQFYSDVSLDISTDLLAHIAHNNQGFDVRDLLDVRYDAESKSYCVLVSWLGFENADNTGEPLANLLQDIPHLVSRFLDKISNQDLAAALREECNL